MAIIKKREDEQNAAAPLTIAEGIQPMSVPGTGPGSTGMTKQNPFASNGFVNMDRYVAQNDQSGIQGRVNNYWTDFYNKGNDYVKNQLSSGVFDDKTLRDLASSGPQSEIDRGPGNQPPARYDELLQTIGLKPRAGAEQFNRIPQITDALRNPTQGRTAGRPDSLASSVAMSPSNYTSGMEALDSSLFQTNKGIRAEAKTGADRLAEVTASGVGIPEYQKTRSEATKAALEGLWKDPTTEDAAARSRPGGQQLYAGLSRLLGKPWKDPVKNSAYDPMPVGKDPGHNRAPQAGQWMPPKPGYEPLDRDWSKDPTPQAPPLKDIEIYDSTPTQPGPFDPIEERDRRNGQWGGYG